MSHTNSQPDDERRPCEVRVHTSAVGRTQGTITCPFCQADVEVFIWSLAGSGKRCSCGALLTAIGAYKGQSKKPRGGSFYHKFTSDECSLGGAEARQRERQSGKRLNHGMRFGRRE